MGFLLRNIISGSRLPGGLSSLMAKVDGSLVSTLKWTQLLSLVFAMVRGFDYLYDFYSRGL
jgi:hypothetical protein